MALVAIAAVAASGCATATSPAPTVAPTGSSGSGAALADRTPVFGSTTCSFSKEGSETSGDQTIVHEHFSCQDEMSDPRVSGADEIDVDTVDPGGTSLALPWTANLVVTNDGGRWRGTCTGALDFTADPTGLPTNYGICTLIGEAGYTGLGYVYLASGSDEQLVLSGWIEPTD